MTTAELVALPDTELIEELLVMLTLDQQEHARPLTCEVLRRGIVEQAQKMALERTADERRRRGHR